MRKLVLLLVLLLAVLILAACGGGQAEVVPEPADPEPQEVEGAATSEPAPAPPEPDEAEDAAPAGDNEPEAQPDFALLVGDFLIEMDQDVAYVLAALGEPLGEFEEPSCAFDGIDRVFAYSDIQIHTYPVGDSDHVHTVFFLSDLVRTTEGGIRLNSDLQAVLDVYGDDYEYDSGMYTFTRGLTTLEFLIRDGKVANIIYGFIIVE